MRGNQRPANRLLPSQGRPFASLPRLPGTMHPDRSGQSIELPPTTHLRTVSAWQSETASPGPDVRVRPLSWPSLACGACQCPVFLCACLPLCLSSCACLPVPVFLCRHERREEDSECSGRLTAERTVGAAARRAWVARHGAAPATRRQLGRDLRRRSSHRHGRRGAAFVAALVAVDAAAGAVRAWSAYLLTEGTTRLRLRGGRRAFLLDRHSGR